MSAYTKAKREWQRSYFAGLLACAKGRTSAAAKLAGMTTANFCKYLREHGLAARDFR